MSINILDFGAIADGVTLNTTAIQRAIDKCAEGAGGRVIVPAGVYKTGTLWLRSNVELHLEMGAELLASENMDDYNALDAYEQNYSVPVENWVGKHLILAHELENCAITGLGRINGNCHAFVTEGKHPWDRNYGWCHGISILKDRDKLRPGQMICFIESKNIKICDVTLINSPCWTCFIHGCEYVQVRGVKIENPIWMLNSDGIDIDASRYVTISDCIINTGDDAITLRASEQRLKNKDMHCEYVTVTNCVLSTGICAFRIGVGFGTIKHARISNIVVGQSNTIVQFCTAYGDKGKADIEDVNFSNISAANTNRCFQGFANNGACIKNITMENIRTTSTIQNYVERNDGVVENIVLRNVELDYHDAATALSAQELAYRGDKLLYLKGADNVTLENVKITGMLYGVDDPIVITNCEGLVKKDCNF
jgi:polygalacturonase